MHACIDELMLSPSVRQIRCQNVFMFVAHIVVLFFGVDDKMSHTPTANTSFVQFFTEFSSLTFDREILIRFTLNFSSNVFLFLVSNFVEETPFARLLEIIVLNLIFAIRLPRLAQWTEHDIKCVKIVM